MTPSRAVDQLRRHPHAVARPANAAFKSEPDSEIPTHLGNIYSLVLVDECRVARDHKQAGDLGQVSNDVIADTVAEIFLLQVAAHVGEWKDHNGGPVGERRGHGRGTCIPCASRHVARRTLVSQSGSQYSGSA